MKLFILQEKLKEGLKLIEKVSLKTINLPVLNNVLISAKKNFLNLSSTNLEIGIQWWGLAKIEKEGEVLVPNYLFSNFINLLPNKQVEIKKENDFLIVRCGEYIEKIKTFPIEDFPIFPQTNKDYYIELNSEYFCQGLEQVVDIASLSQTKPEFTGVYVVINKDYIKLVATDSFRLGEKTLFTQKMNTVFNLINSEVSFILPQKTAKEIINIFKQKKERIKIYPSPDHILIEKEMKELKHSEICLTSRLIDGEYPNYQDIIPNKFDNQIIVNRNDFLNQLKIAALFSGKDNTVTLKINPQKEEIEILSKSLDYGEHQSFLKGKIKSKEKEISFNEKFLSYGLSVINSSEIFLGINNSENNNQEKPVVIKDINNSDYLYIVMPRIP